MAPKPQQRPPPPEQLHPRRPGSWTKEEEEELVSDQSITQSMFYFMSVHSMVILDKVGWYTLKNVHNFCAVISVTNFPTIISGSVARLQTTFCFVCLNHLVFRRERKSNHRGPINTSEVKNTLTPVFQSTPETSSIRNQCLKDENTATSYTILTQSVMTWHCQGGPCMLFTYSKFWLQAYACMHWLTQWQMTITRNINCHLPQRSDVGYEMAWWLSGRNSSLTYLLQVQN